VRGSDDDFFGLDVASGEDPILSLFASSRECADFEAVGESLELVVVCKDCVLGWPS